VFPPALYSLDLCFLSYLLHLLPNSFLPSTPPIFPVLPHLLFYLLAPLIDFSYLLHPSSHSFASPYLPLHMLTSSLPFTLIPPLFHLCPFLCCLASFPFITFPYSPRTFTSSYIYSYISIVRLIQDEQRMDKVMAAGGGDKKHSLKRI